MIIVPKPRHLRGQEFVMAQTIEEAVAAERARCVAVANERVKHLYDAVISFPDNTDWDAQLIEAIVIEQRLATGYVAKESICIRGYHDKEKT